MLLRPTPFVALSRVTLWLVLVVYVCSLIWVFSDARRRGESGLTMALGCGLFFWPLGLMAWLVIRPPVRPSPAHQRVIRPKGGRQPVATGTPEGFLF